MAALCHGGCGKALKGRQRRWCSHACRKKFERKAARDKNVHVVPVHVEALPTALLDAILQRCREATEAAAAHETRQWALAAVSIKSLEDVAEIDRDHVVHEVSLMLDPSNAEEENSQAREIVEAHAPE